LYDAANLKLTRKLFSVCACVCALSGAVHTASVQSWKTLFCNWKSWRY